MTNEPLIHVLIVFDHDAGELRSDDVFLDSDEALAAYAAAESKVRESDQRQVEVVLIGSDSIETIRRTHANYFDESVQASEFLAGL